MPLPALETETKTLLRRRAHPTHGRQWPGLGLHWWLPGHAHLADTMHHVLLLRPPPVMPHARRFIGPGNSQTGCQQHPCHPYHMPNHNNPLPPCPARGTATHRTPTSVALFTPHAASTHITADRPHCILPIVSTCRFLPDVMMEGKRNTIISASRCSVTKCNRKPVTGSIDELHASLRYHTV